MLPSATCSESRWCGGRRFLSVVAGLLLLAAGFSSWAVVLQSQDEALAEAFPDATVQSHTVFLDDLQAEQVEALAGSAPSSQVVTYYVATKDGRLVGTAYFDAHRVRTLPEVLMVVVGPDEAVQRVTILSFREPKDYLPSGRWLEQFHDRKLGRKLSLKQDIRGITGATLSGRAVTAAVRRILALHQVLAESAGNGPDEEPVVAPAPDAGEDDAAGEGR